jgi:hypothetical protein
MSYGFKKVSPNLGWGSGELSPPKKKMQKKEETLQRSLSNYVKMKYPDAVFTSEQSGLFVTPSVMVMLKTTRSNHTKHLDWRLEEPRGGYFGLYLELKKEGTQLYKKDGVTLRVAMNAIYKGKGAKKVKIGEEDRHQLQSLSILDRRQKGYAAFFAVGFDEAIAAVDWYMAMPRTAFTITQKDTHPLTFFGNT